MKTAGTTTGHHRRAPQKPAEPRAQASRGVCKPVQPITPKAR